MRGGAVIALVGLTALVAYGIGRQDSHGVKPAAAPAASQQTKFAKPVALTSLVDGVAVPTTAQPAQPPAIKPAVQDKPVDKKRIGEAILTAAAIAALIVKASRDQYYATGHPCACPDDLMRNGRACGGRSAYSRPGGASPLCYPTDVTAAMIDSYRQKAATR